MTKSAQEPTNSGGANGGGGDGSDKSTSGPSSPTPSVSCETCSQLSQLELEAFAAVREVAPFVRSISISEMLSRTAELLFLNLVTLENESYCIELTQRGWRICSDRLDCMYGDFKKLDMHVAYYDTIYQLLDNLSKQYRERFGEALARKLSDLQNQQQQQKVETKSTAEGEGQERGRSNKQETGSRSASRDHSPLNCGNPDRRQQPCDGCVDATATCRSRTPPPSTSENNQATSNSGKK